MFSNSSLAIFYSSYCLDIWSQVETVSTVAIQQWGSWNMFKSGTQNSYKQNWHPRTKDLMDHSPTPPCEILAILAMNEHVAFSNLQLSTLNFVPKFVKIKSLLGSRSLGCFVKVVRAECNKG